MTSPPPSPPPPSPHALTPVFVALRWGLHGLVAVLACVVAVSVVVDGGPVAVPASVATAVLVAVYVAGARLARLPAGRRRAAGLVWLGLLTLAWAVLAALVPEAAYLAFPLFFCVLHLLPPPGGPVAVAGVTLVAVVAIGARSGFTPAGVIGPVVGAGVAVLIGSGYRALAREALEREALLAELVATRSRLAATEREQGILAERSRLAREIHDTVAQSLSSIQMLLHAADRAEPGDRAAAHIGLARTAAADSLGEVRRFIRELSPAALDDGLPSALRRLADSYAHALRVEVDAPASTTLPMDHQTALLRVAQGALANVVQHARASRADLRLSEADGAAVLSVIDDGVGFDRGSAGAATSSDSFGLRAIEERVSQIGGTLEVVTAPGRGTEVTVRVGERR